jgi:hypothetical protein
MANRLNCYFVTGMTKPIDNRIFLIDKPWRTSTNMVRCAFLELCSREIYRMMVPGEFAEVGVGEGGTASLLNHHFADRKLLLFDTFTGFDSRDLARNDDLGLGGAPLSRIAELPHCRSSKFPTRRRLDGRADYLVVVGVTSACLAAARRLSAWARWVRIR